MQVIIEDDFSSGDFSKWTGGTNEVNADLAIVGGKMVVSAPGGAVGNTYARVIENLVPGWVENVEWETEFIIRLPSDFWTASFSPATFQPFGWDTFPIPNIQMRMMFWGGDAGLGRMYLVGHGPAIECTGQFFLPAGEDVTVRVNQLLHTSAGWTTVSLNGEQVASGNSITWVGSPALQMRYGWADFSELPVPKETEYSYIRLSATGV